MRVRLIVNPVAGAGQGRAAAERLFRALRAKLRAVDLVETLRPGHATEVASDDGADCVIAVGGDGSLNEVANGLAPGRLLAVLPVGTANVVARELRIPRVPEALADLITRGSSVKIDAGLQGARRFLLGAGAGLDAAVVAAMQRRRGRRNAYWRWVAPTIATVLRYTYPRMRVEVDGEVLCEDAQYVIVGNCTYSAGFFPSTPLAKPNDGLLDVCAVERLHPLKIAYLAVAVWHPSFIRDRDIHYRQGQHIVVTPVGDAEVPMHLDGESAGSVPAEFRVAPHAFQVIAPDG